MKLVRYRPNHLNAVLALHRSAIAGFDLGITQAEDEADLLSINEEYLRDGGEFLIGFLGERLVAMGGFKRLSPTSAELRRMRIEQNLQGKGCGTLLLQELERIAWDGGVRVLSLETARQRPRTLEFYRKHGYEETGDGFYGGVETVHFRKELEPQ